MRYGPFGRQVILTGIGVPPGWDLRLAGSDRGALAPTLPRRRPAPPRTTSVHGRADHVDREGAGQDPRVESGRRRHRGRRLASMREPGAVLLVACYELGHQPLTLAWPAAFLERRGYA